MSRVDFKTFRANDRRSIVATLNIDYDSSFDEALVSFQSKGVVLGITSTSLGYIDGENHVKLHKGSEVLVHLDHCEADKLECLVGYYEKNELKYHEALTAPVEKTPKISEAHVETRQIGSKSKSFDQKLSTFLDSLSHMSSDWLVNVSCSQEIALKFLSRGNHPTKATFGEISSELMSSDYVFTIYPEVSNLVFPNELLKKQYSKYTKGARLGLFELIQADFIEIPSLYFKVPISNVVHLSELSIK